jgi:hypothetical protein
MSWEYPTIKNYWLQFADMFKKMRCCRINIFTISVPEIRRWMMDIGRWTIKNRSKET